MTDTAELRKQLQTKLASILSRAYYSRAPLNPTKPYMTYSLESRDSRPSLDYLLDIDIWDNAESTVSLETYADSVENTLDGDSISTTDLNAKLYLNQRFSLEDEDETLTRRRLTFDMRVYYK